MGVGGGGGGGESLGIIKVKRNFNTYLKLNILGIYRGGRGDRKKNPFCEKNSNSSYHSYFIYFFCEISNAC